MLKTLELPRDVTVPGHARRAVDQLRPHLHEAAVRDARLLVSELVSNSVTHGRGDALRMALEVDHRGSRRCDVSDCGAGFVPTARPAERESGGWGLEIVAKLTDRWGVREGPTQVWFELSDRAA